MSDDNDAPARIHAQLGGFEVEVEGADLEEAEATFERVWERRLEEAGEMADSLQARLAGVQ